MTLDVMEGKMSSDKNIKIVTLNNHVSRGGGEDTPHDNDIVIIPDVVRGYEDSRTGAVFVILERENKEAVQVYLGVFDRSVQPYDFDEDNIIIAVGDRVNAEGTTVQDWKNSENAKAFFEKNKGKKMRFTLKSNIQTRAWDRKINDWSSIRLQNRKVYDINWV